MRSKVLLFIILIISALLLSGCQTTVTVRNAGTKEIIPAFKDYIGIQGYSLTYENDKTGAYSVNMGNVFVSGRSTTTKSKTVNVATSNQLMTAYEETSWDTVNDPARYEKATAAVKITQKGDDVTIFIDTNTAGGTSLNDIKDYLKGIGYQVD